MVAPTREIAAQIESVLSILASDIKQLKCALAIGGTNVKDDKVSLFSRYLINQTNIQLLML